MDHTINNIQLRTFEKLSWVNPKQALINLRYIELNLPLELDEKAKRLRTNNLKVWREARDAALFTYGMSQTILNTSVLFSNVEDSDYDFVMKWVKDEKIFYYPVQLKELPPDDLNSKVQIENIIDKLKKYSGEGNLAVAININRKLKSFNLLQSLETNKLKIKELWYFGCKSPDQSKWFLYGNLLKDNPLNVEFQYPEGEHNLT